MKYLQNGKFKLGVDLNLGCVITEFLDFTHNRNVINSHDLGREVQPSFYAGPTPYADCEWSGQAWPWNPIGCGDAYGNPSKLKSFSQTNETLTCIIVPMQWACNNIPCECEFSLTYTLSDSYAKGSVTLSNHRSDQTDYGTYNQELPAVYSNGFLYRMIGYSGDYPWTNDTLIEYITGFDSFWVPGAVSATEKWMCLASSDDYSLGVYAPGNDIIKFLGGFAGGDNSKGHGNSHDAQTGYLAPIADLNIKSDEVYTYDFYLILGQVEDVRAIVYTLHSDQVDQ